MAKPKGAPKTGGRQKGVPNKATAEIKEIARQYGPKAVKELAKLAGLDKDSKGKAESEAARIGALNAILDRGYGKAPQTMAGEGGDGEPTVKHIVEVLFGRGDDGEEEQG
jgi:hypothetical protein